MKLYKSKLFQLIMVIVLVGSIVVTGTYAWGDYFGNATEEVLKIAPPNVTLMDFSDKLGEIYVINSGGEEMLVRTRLGEYMEIDQKPLAAGSLRDDKTTWPIMGDKNIQKYYKMAFTNAVMTMEEWIKGDEEQGREPHEKGDYWVRDVDGWYYYAMPVPAGSATRTLISEIRKQQFQILINSEYNVEVWMQALPKSEAVDFYQNESTATENGKLIIRYLSGEFAIFA